MIKTKQVTWRSIKKIPHSLKSIFSFLLLSIILASTFTQVASALDEKFYSGNDIFFTSPSACKAKNTGDTSLVGNDNAEKIWNYFIQKGLTAEQAAGVLGNIQAESGFNPAVVEGGSGIGFGIAQWSYERRTALENAAKNAEPPVPASDLKFQLDYLFAELNARKPNTSSKNKSAYHQGYANEWEALKGQKKIEDALVAFHNNFERSHLMNAGGADAVYSAVVNARGKFAQNAFASFNNKSAVPEGGDTAGVGEASVVFLDPGHGGAVPQYIDQKTGLADRETSNGQEDKDVLDVANRVKADLTEAGYQVVLSRSTNEDKTTKRARADAAAAARAAIGVSIHTTPGQINQAWPQRVGTYREYNGKRTTFTDKNIASKSDAYAKAFAEARTAAEGHAVSTDPGNVQQAASFGTDRVPSKGNIPIISLWSPTVPWVYNEIAQTSGGTIDEARKAAYTKGIIDAIKKVIPTGSGSQCGNDAAFGGGNLAQTTMAYAWPTYKGLTVNAKPEWSAAVKKARGEGKYVGGIRHPGIDCGGFVTTLLVNSGFEPNYNYGGKSSAGAGPTGTQRAWSEKFWKRVGNGNEVKVGGDSKSDDKVLRAGDVAHLQGHTFIYVGDIPGFSSKIASASLDERAPMAGKENITASDTTWYRRK